MLGIGFAVQNVVDWYVKRYAKAFSDAGKGYFEAIELVFEGIDKLLGLLYSLGIYRLE